MNPTIAAALTALTAVEQALDAEERRLAVRALVDAGVRLQEQVIKREAWLQRNWQRMEDYTATLTASELAAKEAIYLEKIAEYETWVNALGEALLAIDVPMFEVRQESLL